MNILIVTQYFWPENFRINDLCSELSKRGHEVTVLTGKPNYPEGDVFKDYIDNAEKLDHYEGCNVIRVPMIARGKDSSIKLVLNYLSYAFSATFIGAWKLKNKKFDVIFAFQPSPITVGLPAIYLKFLKKSPIVFWVQDLWPETLEAVGVVKSKTSLKAVGKLVSFIYNRCDLILGQSKAFEEGISNYCKDKTKIKYFPNWSEKIFSSINFIPIVEMDGYTEFKILFAGNIGDAQDFPSIISAVEILKNKNINCKFFIVGDGRAMKWLIEEIKTRDLADYISLLGRHPLENMPSFYYSADALLVSLKEDDIFSMTIPGKVQSYMAASKPILTMLSGEGSRVVKEANCGYTAESGDAETLANNIKLMSNLSKDQLSVLGNNAKTYSDIEFDRNKLITQLESFLKKSILDYSVLNDRKKASANEK